MLLQNNLENDTHRAESYGRFISLLKEVYRILEKVKKLPPQGQSPELAGLLAENILRVKGKKDWGDSIKYGTMSPEYTCGRHEETARGDPLRFAPGVDQASHPRRTRANAASTSSWTPPPLHLARILRQLPGIANERHGGQPVDREH